MKSFSSAFSVVLALAALFPGPALRAQNPVPNSPPALVTHNPPLQPAANAATKPTDSAAPAPGPQQPPAVTTVSGDYILATSDTVEMSVFNEPSLTTQTRVSADGTVQFPLIGEIKLGGMPVRDARELIRRKYNADYLVEPQVYLNVIGYAQRHFTVLGQVNRPGTYDFPGGEHLGLMEAIGQAGGFTRLANESTVQVKRTAGGGDHTFKVNTKKLTTGANKPFELSAGDVITVGESWF